MIIVSFVRDTLWSLRSLRSLWSAGTASNGKKHTTIYLCIRKKRQNNNTNPHNNLRLCQHILNRCIQSLVFGLVFGDAHSVSHKHVLNDCLFHFFHSSFSCPFMSLSLSICFGLTQELSNIEHINRTMVTAFGIKQQTTNENENNNCYY